MPGLAICPYCRATVQPHIDSEGTRICPQCNNQGTAGAGLPNAPGAVASLVFGILAVVTGLLGLIAGPIAVVLAGQARDALRNHPGQYGGDGLASAGRILGFVGIGLSALTLVFAIFVFVLVENLSSH